MGTVFGEAVTVAVNVTGTPASEGEPEDATVVLLVYSLTFSLKGEDVAPEKFESPE